MTEIGDFLKLLLEAIAAWKKLQEDADAKYNKKKAKKLKKVCLKAIKSGKDDDLAAVRKYLYIINWK